MAQTRTACFHVTALGTATQQEAVLMASTRIQDTIVRVSVISILTMRMVEHSQDRNVKLVRFYQQSFLNTAVSIHRNKQRRLLTCRKLPVSKLMCGNSICVFVCNRKYRL